MTMTVTNNTAPTPLTIEWFKNNCTILENGISPDYSDSITDLTLLQGWITWAEVSGDPIECVEYFYEVCLPKVVNSLLTKKYQNVEAHIAKAKETLIRITESLAKQFRRFPESISDILMNLFQQKHPFYLKYGYPKVLKIESSRESSGDQSWTSSLAVGHCLDGQSPTGEWEIIVVDELSPVGTEIYVTWSSGNPEWLRLDDNPRLAKFGTKTGVYGDSLPDQETPPAPSIPTVDEITGLSQDEDYNWRAALGVGNLVDAKDKTGNWYQACILEIAHVETSPICPPVPNAESTNVDAHLEEREETNVDVMKAELFALKNQQESNSADVTEEVIPPVTVVMTFVRVCFLGWMEFYDDWIELNSTAGRLAPLNSKSLGNRGDNYIREEVKILSKFWEKKNQSSPSRECAFSPEPALVSPYYALIVNKFFVEAGISSFHQILHERLCENSCLSRASNMKLIVSLGLSAEVLSKNFFDYSYLPSISSISTELVSFVERYIDFLLREELRATKTEALEQILISYEQILKSMGVSFEDVSVRVDPLWVRVALECIKSPYLNRRLGGLKILTDLLRRLEQSILYPHSLRVTRSVQSASSSSSSVSTATSTSPSSTATSTPTLSLSSYTFVPPCSLDTMQLCQTILAILPPVFLGETAHEALMQRSTEILKYLCTYNSFDPNLLSILWDIGCNHKNATVLQVLQDLIPSSFSFEILEQIATQIQALSPSLVSLQIVDMLSAIALRCRGALLEKPLDFLRTTLPSKIHYSHDQFFEPSPPSSPQTTRVFTGLENLHELSISTLFMWAQDGSNVNDAVALRCVPKLESILELGLTSSLVIQWGSTFPWMAHWKRCYETVLRALNCLRMNQSILLSIKTIRSFFLSWIKEDDYVKANVILHDFHFFDSDHDDMNPNGITLNSFYRHSISQYFEERYHLLDLVTSAILSLKEKFSGIARGIIEESRHSDQLEILTNAYQLSGELQSVLNVIMIEKSRIGFKDQLESLFDFIQFLVRSSPSIRFTFSTVQQIWTRVLLEAITPQERDLVFSFLNRLIVNRSPSAVYTSNDSSRTEHKSDQVTDSGFAETKESTPNPIPSGNIQPTYGRLSFCLEGDVSLIYSDLLCHHEFIRSAHFSELALLCLEKYFKWISANNGTIVELPGKDGNFIILKSLSAQTEWKIFPKIVMYCQEDKVALDAVKFLTAFPQRLSQSLVYDGDVITLRQSILSQSMAELEDIRNQALGSVSIITNPTLTMKLKRTIMLLNSLLDESSADSSKRVKSHSGKWKSKPVTIKVQYSKQSNYTITLDSDDTLDDLLLAIATTLSKDIKQLKCFRRGSELTMNNLIRRTLRQMDLLMNETIVVVDRPVTSLPTSSLIKPYICPLESLPGVILSSKLEYLEILFSLIDSTSGSICDDIWELIIRLPTSPQAWNTWKSMVSVNSIYSDSDSTKSNLNLFTLNSDQSASKLDLDSTVIEHSLGKRVKIPRSLSRLIYNLQIIESFLHAAPQNSKGGGNEIEDIDEILTDDDDDLWIGMFIAFGGIKALEDAFVYIIQQCSIYCHQQTDKEKSSGLTSKLIHCALILITKIIRSIMIRGVVCAKPIFFDQIATLLRAVSSSTLNSQEINLDAGKKPTISAVTCGDPVLSEEEELKKRLNSIEEREELLSHEWGNKFNAHFDVANASSSELLESTINLSQIQSTVFNFLILLPKFSSEAVFTPNSPQSLNLLSVREQIQNNQKEFLYCLENIFIIWGSALVLDPTLIRALTSSAQENGDEVMELETPFENFRVKNFVSIQNLLSIILTQFPSSQSVTNTDSLHRFPALVGYSSMMGLLTILTFIEGCSSEERETGLDLRCNFLNTLFSLRPQVSRFSSSRGKNKNDAAMDSENLFIFASKLLQDDHQWQQLQLAEQQIVEICSEIYQELTSIDLCGDPQQQSCCSGKYQNIPMISYFTGNMRLLQSLLRQSQMAMNILLEKGLVDYLINNCLGIRPPDSISLNILCNDSDTRLQSYNILRLIVSDGDRSSQIYQRVSGVHLTLEQPNQWSFNPVRDMRSPVGYVGLKNMGCTCYMNSLLQILYMNPLIRRRVLEFKVETFESSEDLKDNLLYQLKFMFQYLLHSTRKSFTPEGWMFAYKDETGLAPVNVLHQQDAQEFLQVLCERMEKLLVDPSPTGSNNNSSGDPNPLLSSIYGVQICDQMIKEGVDVTTSNLENRDQYIREKHDMMMCISLDVRGTNGLESSLKKFVAGESLSDYLWNEDQPRVNITKRQCLGNLSDSVIFHLKRFELNFDTFLREKVNDEFPFPTRVDLYPYTKEGLEGISPQALGRTSSHYFYELTGIVVHTGTTDSGHYYSYIKESLEDATERYNRDNEVLNSAETPIRRWVEFNDSEIQLFTEARIASECFGGSVADHEYNVSSQTWLTTNTTNQKNAYMLVYQRTGASVSSNKAPEDQINPHEQDLNHQDMEVPSQNDTQDETMFPPVRVIRDNQYHLLASRCYTQEHIEFFLALEESYLSHHNLFNCCSEEEFLTTSSEVKSNICDFVTFLAQYVSRSLYHQSYQAGCDIVVNLLDNLLLLGQSSQEDSLSNNATSYSEVLKNSTPTDSSTSSSESKQQGANYGVMRTKFCVEICQTLLSYFMNFQNGEMMQNLIFAPEKLIRITTTKFIFKLFVILISFAENLESRLKNLNPVVLKCDAMTPCSISELPQAAREEIESIVTLPLAIQFLLMITKNSYFLQCGELWRRSDGYLWLLLQLAQQNLSIRVFLIRRDVMMQLIDLFLGDFSPLCGELYIKGTRKRAPTSYVTIVPEKDGKLSNTAQYTPDWTDLLQTLSLLVQSSVTPSMLRSVYPIQNATISGNGSNSYILDPSNYRLLQTRLLYAHALRQQRYVAPISSIISHLANEDRTYSIDCIAEVITEGLQYATLESIAQYFDVIEAFLCVQDTLQSSRIQVLFDATTGSILQLMKNFMTNKPQHVCIVIQSLFTLIVNTRERIRSLFFTMKNRLSEWAPWILKFCFQYVQKTAQELDSTVSGPVQPAIGASSSSAPSTAPTPEVGPTPSGGSSTMTVSTKKGLYTRIYGEGEEDRELNTAERALKTFEIVQHVMRTMDAVPDAHIPVDAFEMVSVNENDDIPAETLARILDEETKSSSMEVGTGTEDIALSDAMTDEEFARYLASALD